MCLHRVEISGDCDDAVICNRIAHEDEVSQSSPIPTSSIMPNTDLLCIKQGHQLVGTDGA